MGRLVGHTFRTSENSQLGWLAVENSFVSIAFLRIREDPGSIGHRLI